MSSIAIIPARFASSRFPGKPLANIADKSMIQRVYEQVRKVDAIEEVIVATDDERIFTHVEKFGGKVLMTSTEHQSGTDRCAEVALQFPHTDVVLNIQGDEPFIQPEQIRELLNCFEKPTTQIATLIKEIKEESELLNFSIPKVVINKQLEALYFSRHSIPFQRSHPQNEWMEHHTYFKHIGIYGYRRHTLLALTKLKPSSLELTEALEQLRWLENGFRIQTAITEFQSYGIDHLEDIEHVLKKVNNK